MKDLTHFAYGHLPPELQTVSRRFHNVADALLATLPDDDQRAVALQKLLEAKDAAVRSCVAAKKE